jgi:hypothetical protein
MPVASNLKQDAEAVRCSVIPLTMIRLTRRHQDYSVSCIA